MMFWIAVAILAAAVTYTVTRPLLRAPDAIANQPSSDIAVYKDQLSEIDADVARGLIDATEAEAARAEVARRVLRQTDNAPSMPLPSNVSFVNAAYYVTALALPLLSLALYMTYGAPGMSGLPLKERLAAAVDGDRPDDLIAKVEARLREHPEDGKGWDVVAPVYMAGERFVDAAEAFAKAMKLLGESPARLMGFANARISVENGIVPEDARKALQSLAASDPKLKEPRVWLALAKEQDGKVSEAAADYRVLIADAPETAPWRRFLQERLDRLDGTASMPPVTAAPQSKGPDAASVAAVEAMNPEERQAFITRMVDGLAERMKTNTKDKDGWLKLIRAYQMSGRKDDAVRAVASAKSGLAGDTGALQAVDALAKELGVGG